jgi:L-threonylcarbamoyladenylate synthase
VKADDCGRASAADALRAGQVVLIPTDTVYGLAVRAADAAALAQLFVLKRRPPERSIAVLVANLAQAERLAELNDHERAVVEKLWPGALTLVVARRDGIDPGLGRDDGTIALRRPDHDFVSSLAADVGPLATTSANISGHPTPADPHVAAASLDGEVAVVIDDGPLTASASTVVRIDDSGAVAIVRQGSVTRDQIVSAVHGKESDRK